MYILGVNCFSHDTAACLLKDGQLVAFVEEERFNREKHTKKFPLNAINYCLAEAGININQLDYVAFAYQPHLDFRRALADIPRYLPYSWRRLFLQPAIDLLLYLKKPYFKRRFGYKGKVVFVGHHEAHAAASFFVSPFKEAAILSLDRGGDYLSTLLAYGKDNQITPLKYISQPHSLGEVYAAVTDYLGFKPNSDEGKTMGLAPYGRDTYKKQFEKLVKLLPDGEFQVELSYFTYYLKGGWYSQKFIREFGPARKKDESLNERFEDIAAGVQHITEKTAFHLSNYLFQKTGSKNLCVAGGVGLNSVMNGQLLKQGPFKEVFIQPAANDAGNALGAALWLWHQLLNQKERFKMVHAYYGPAYSVAEMEAALKAANLSYQKVADPAKFAAEKLAAGKIVGWFQGRAEVGPRALGHRSILANPCLAEMKDTVNLRIKKREPFRPFAPAINEEYAADYLEIPYPTPFMLHVFGIKKEKQNEIPAVCHVDGSARWQTVSQQTSLIFWQLIEEFRKLTGTPVVLNTSFNVKGEPIVLTPTDAINCFLNSGLDYLVLGPFTVASPSPSSA